MALGAVITGDIVASTQLGKPVLKKLLKEMEAILSPYLHEFYRGDSFQFFVKNPAEALTLVLQLRMAAMRAATSAVPLSDVRASIGIGNVKGQVKELRTAQHEAFILSGRAFDQLTPPQRLTIVAPATFETVNTALELVSNFTDYILQRMTVKQAAVVAELLQSRTQKEAAGRLKKTQATINKHARAAGWPQLEGLQFQYRQLIGNLIL